MAQMTPLRRRLLDDMTVRNLSPATQQSYVYAVAKFSRFFGVAPDQLGNEDVRTYQVHLAGLGMSWSHINQVSCALRFFYGVTLGRKDAAVRIVSAKEPRKLPVVLSVDEIVRFLQAVPGLRNRTALTTAYSEPRRDFRRLQFLRRWSHDREHREEVCTGSPRSSGQDGV